MLICLPVYRLYVAVPDHAEFCHVAYSFCPKEKMLQAVKHGLDSALEESVGNIWEPDSGCTCRGWVAAGRDNDLSISRGDYNDGIAVMEWRFIGGYHGISRADRNTCQVSLRPAQFKRTPTPVGPFLIRIHRSHSPVAVGLDVNRAITVDGHGQRTCLALLGGTGLSAGGRAGVLLRPAEGEG